MVRLRKPMLYPLSYEGITGLSCLSPLSCCLHSTCTRSGEGFATNHDYSPLFKHENTTNSWCRSTIQPQGRERHYPNIRACGAKDETTNDRRAIALI